MLNFENIIESIRDDAPAVYDILNEIYVICTGKSYICRLPRGKEWDTFRKNYPEISPTADQLLEVLTEYDGNNYDVYYWSGRYAQMIETDNAINDMIAVFEENKKKLAPMMDYEYTLKIELLKNVQEFIGDYTTP